MSRKERERTGIQHLGERHFADTLPGHSSFPDPFHLEAHLLSLAASPLPPSLRVKAQGVPTIWDHRVPTSLHVL